MQEGVVNLTERVARLEEAVHRLDGWQKQQNGTLIHLDEKIDNLTETLNIRFDEIKTLIYEKKESTERRFESKSAQKITWVITLLIGLPTSLYGIYNLIKVVTGR